MNGRVPFVVTVLSIGLAGAACSAPVPPMDRGIAYYRNVQYLQARDVFDDAVRQSPRSAAAYNNRAVARVRLGDLSGAVQDYNRAIALSPADPELYFNRANALVTAGQYAAAVDDFTHAIDLSPAFARAYFNRGTARLDLGAYDAALADWRHAIDIEPDPWARGAMVRAVALAPTTVASVPPSAQPPAATALPPRPAGGEPTTVTTIAPPPPPGTMPGGTPLPTSPAVAAAPPAASPQGIDARALATRAISRELDGDHTGALQDLGAAIALETDAAWRDAMVDLLHRLETPR